MKSGSNHLHGSVFGFLSNDNLNANSWSNNHGGAPKNAYTQSTFGGTFGGPIIKDKLFYFVDYEAFRYHLSGAGFASVVPGPFRTGDLSRSFFAEHPVIRYSSAGNAYLHQQSDSRCEPGRDLSLRASGSLSAPK